MNHNISAQTNKDNILCKFFLQGNCKFGPKCVWLHDEAKKKEFLEKDGSNPQGNSTKIEKIPQPCFFFFSGNCMKGELCPYSHELLFDDATDSDATNKNKNERKLNSENILKDKTMVQLITDSKDKECSICFDGVVSQKRIFGLLSNCDHVYCLECIRNWRATDQQDGEKAIDSVNHTCPLCRQLSPFVVPSPVHAVGEIKTKITTQYLARLKQIPCKYFKYGEGYCPFNAACFYAHVNKDGSIATLAQNLRNKPRIARRSGFLIDSQRPFIISTRLLELMMPFMSDAARAQILAYSIDEEDEEMFSDQDDLSQSDSDSVNMDYTQESDDSDDEDIGSESGSGSRSNDELTDHYMAQALSGHYGVYCDSDSDAPERQLYDGNWDPDGADLDVSSGSDSSPRVHSAPTPSHHIEYSHSNSNSDSLSDVSSSLNTKSIQMADLSESAIDSCASSTSAPNLESDSSSSQEEDSGSDSVNESQSDVIQCASSAASSDDDISDDYSSNLQQDSESDFYEQDSDDYASD